MFLLIDTANPAEVARALEVFPLAGVTTSPAIVVREKRDLFAILRDIRSVIGDRRMLHAQVLGATSDEILRDALRLSETVSGEFYVKVPVTLEGFKAMPLLRKEKIAFTATAIHTPAQAFLAAEHGAAFLAPYINRIDNLGSSGAETVRAIAGFLKLHELPARILAASFRNVRQITDVLLAGAHTVTLSPELVWKFAENPATDQSIGNFREQWNGFYGEGKSVYNL